MRELFLDCTKGISGDMLVSSLMCHLGDESIFKKAMAGLKVFETASITVENSVRYSLKGKSFHVNVKNNQPLRHLSDIVDIIFESDLRKGVKTKIIKAFEALAEAESKVHGISVGEVHFHEIGAVDTIIDIAAFYVLLDILEIDRLIFTSVNVGKGTVNCEHGVLPVPAPAVAELMKGMEIFSCGDDGERTTPTGAVLMKMSAEQGEMPIGKLVSIGYGFGKRDFSDGNYLRSMIFENGEKYNECVYLLECNIDDMTGEALAFAANIILDSGALDVWQEAVYMKKNRLGTKLCVLCRDTEFFTELIFKYTSTLGIRINKVLRSLRGESTFTEADGIRIKCTGDIKKPEFEDVKNRAIEKGMSLAQVYDSINTSDC